jgi:hypothetical protein
MKKIPIYFIFLALYLTTGAQVSFVRGGLSGTTFNFGTSLQFGPDNRLYVAQQDGLIHIYKVARFGAANYQVIQSETITSIRDITNHNDDGTINTSVNYRLVTGLLVAGTKQNPIIYVTSSDPRYTEDTTSVSELDTNSGIISRLTWNGTQWVKVDLVRGLPRSTEVHAPNGMQLDTANNILYVAQGGHTNMGAPSGLFTYLPEYALSACVLAVNLAMIGDSTYDLPTLDDENKNNLPNPVLGYEDTGDPFGGNKGKNMACLKVGEPVQVFASGLRNAYDVLLKSNGKLYTIDNAPNGNYGGAPVNCTNAVNEANSNPGFEGLYLLNQGTYCGHGNPTRGSYNNTFNTTNPQHPVDLSLTNSAECTYLTRGLQDGAITTFPGSTNGFAEYTATNFNSALKGELIAAFFDGSVLRIKLNASGDSLAPGGQQILAGGFGSDNPLDIATQGDSAIFPGTIWIVNFLADSITVLEPADYNGCISSTSTITINSCNSYNTPSGQVIGQSGTFQDIVSNSTGCDSVITINLTIIPVDTTISQTGDTLTANGSASTYLWIDCANGNTIINNQNGKSFSPSANGLYAAVLIGNLCQDTTECYNFVKSGIADNYENAQMVLYPNPTNQNFEVSLSGPCLQGKLVIRDMLGRMIDEHSYNPCLKEIFTLPASPGIYFVSVVTPSGVSCKSIIKE